MKWRVVIPTYARAEALRDYTLKTLLDGGIPRERIDVFVASEEERARYVEVLPKKSYSKIIVAEVGMHAVRNAITAHYEEGARLVQVDDDVRGVFRALDAKRMEPVTDLVRMCDEGFEACAAAKARLWGLYPVCNAFYMKPGSVTFDLRPIIGTFYGNINARAHRLECLVKSDVERTLLYYAEDGTVVRFNGVAPKQNAHKEAGGMQATGARTVEASQAAAEALIKRFPRWVSMKPGFKRGHAEVRLKGG